MDPKDRSLTNSLHYDRRNNHILAAAMASAAVDATYAAAPADAAAWLSSCWFVVGPAQHFAVQSLQPFLAWWAAPVEAGSPTPACLSVSFCLAPCVVWTALQLCVACVLFDA